MWTSRSCGWRRWCSALLRSSRHPGAGPSLAWTCGLAAALVEMVSAVTLRQQPPDPSAIEQRRDRATAVRHQALSLADTDAAAYREVLA